MAIFLLACIAVLVVLFAAATIAGTQRWQAEILKLRAKMYQVENRSENLSKVDFSKLNGLPDPVQRYFRAVLKDGQLVISTIRVEQSGYFDLGLGSGKGNKEDWKPFRATQWVRAKGRPGFVWDARIRMGPMLATRVCDAYVAGEGLLVAKILGIFTVAKHRGTSDVAEGELMRFFAEAAWYPTTLLDRDHVTWKAIGSRSAKGIFVDGTTRIPAVFRFDDEGLVESVEMDRLRLVNGKSVRTKWVGRFTNYESISGMRVPVRGEVFWEISGMLRPYWRGRLTSIEFEST